VTVLAAIVIVTEIAMTVNKNKHIQSIPLVDTSFHVVIFICNNLVLRIYLQSDRDSKKISNLSSFCTVARR
jgi:hypothetical protein